MLGNSSSTSPSPRQSERWYGGHLFFAGALIGYWVFVAAFVDAHEIRVVHDDAFINYVYARNLAEGMGPVFNVGERVWGYTSPAQVLLLATGIALGADVESFATACGFAFACVSGFLVFCLLRRVTREDLAAALGAAYLITLAPIFSLHVTLEGNFLIASQLLFLEVLLRGRVSTAAVLGGLSCLVRPDSIVLVLPALLLYRTGRRPLSILLFGLPGLLWIAFTGAYYGSIVPTTLWAKSGASDFFGYVTSMAYFTFGPGFPGNVLELEMDATGWCLAAAKLALLLLGARASSRIGPAAGYALVVYPFVLLLAYAWIGAPQHHWEIQSASFFFHLGAVAGLLALLGETQLPRPAWLRALRFAAALAAIALVTSNLTATTRFLIEQRSWAWRGAKYDLYAQIAGWVNLELPASTRLAASEVGILGYLSEGFAVVDEVGLVSNVVGLDGRLTDAAFLASQRPDHALLAGRPRPASYRGRRTQPLQMFVAESEDAGAGAITLVRILESGE